MPTCFLLATLTGTVLISPILSNGPYKMAIVTRGSCPGLIQNVGPLHLWVHNTWPHPMFSHEGWQGAQEAEVPWAAGHRAAFLGEVGETQIHKDSKMGFTGCGAQQMDPSGLRAE